MFEQARSLANGSPSEKRLRSGCLVPAPQSGLSSGLGRGGSSRERLADKDMFGSASRRGGGSHVRPSVRKPVKAGCAVRSRRPEQRQSRRADGGRRAGGIETSFARSGHDGPFRSPAKRGRADERR